MLNISQSRGARKHFCYFVRVYTLGQAEEIQQISEKVIPQQHIQLTRLFNETPELATQAHVVNAFKKIARKQQQIHPKTLHALIQYFNQNWQDYDSHAVAKIVWAMGKKQQGWMKTVLKMWFQRQHPNQMNSCRKIWWMLSMDWQSQKFQTNSS
eukprot:TRINITY_DN65994_c0_g1_i1.p2 TRINITY_DN65994_c0_g1~~TRINITY_DN65994_c0_g1_i1.p2  ORF type:complete len:154 (-),score=15.05 TRINITY_DN65994_c0_g1_i1:23-484(-)